MNISNYEAVKKKERLQAIIKSSIIPFILVITRRSHVIHTHTHTGNWEFLCLKLPQKKSVLEWDPQWFHVLCVAVIVVGNKIGNPSSNLNEAVRISHRGWIYTYSSIQLSVFRFKKPTLCYHLPGVEGLGKYIVIFIFHDFELISLETV